MTAFDRVLETVGFRTACVAAWACVVAAVLTLALGVLSFFAGIARALLGAAAFC